MSPEDKALMRPELLGALRGFVWGLPPTVILENEKATFLGEENGTLFYKDYVRDMQVTVAYEFHENKLWRARTFIENEYIDPYDRIEHLIQIRSDLTKRFGEPVDEKFEWLKETEKNFPKKWGWAVFRGELFITIKWQNQETEVVAFLGAPEYLKPKFDITYFHRRVNNKLKQDRRDNLLRAP